MEQAFQLLESPERPLMVLLDYGENLSEDFSVLVHQTRKAENRISCTQVKGKHIRVGLIDAGGFAVGTHLPNLKRFKDKYEIRAICNRTGHKAQAVALHYGARFSTTEQHEIISNADIDLVMIYTRHNLHSQIFLERLQAGKHTFVEKPLCTKSYELDAIKDFYDSKFETRNSKPPMLMVGFNRRFSRIRERGQKAYISTHQSIVYSLCDECRLYSSGSVGSYRRRWRAYHRGGL